MQKKFVSRFLLLILLFGFFPHSFSQNLDYSLQNNLERIYSNPEKDVSKDFTVFRQTFISEGYSSFDYLSKILAKNKNLKKDYPIFFIKTDKKDGELFRKNIKELTDRGEFGKAWLLSSDVFWDYLSSPSRFFAFASVCFKNVYFALYMFVFFFGVLSLIKYFRQLYYDVDKFIKSKGVDNEFAVYVAMFTVLVFPVFLTVNIKFLPLYWVVLFFIYNSKKQKTVIFATVVLLLFSLIIEGFLSNFSVYYLKNFSAYEESLNHPFSGITINGEGKDDMENFAVATTYLRQGDAVNSVKYYKKIEVNSPLYKYALNNMGVAYVFLSRPKLALNFFKDAINKESGYEAYINSYLVNSRAYNVVEAEESLKKSFKTDNFKTPQWLMFNIKAPVPVIAVPDGIELFSIAFTGFEFSKSLKDFAGGIVFFLLFLLAIGVVQFVFRDISITKACKKCGTPFRLFESQHEHFCRQCAVMFTSRGEMAGEMIAAKRREIKIYLTVKRVVEILFGIVLPGFYNVFVREKVFSGLLIFLFSLILLLDSVRAYKVTANIVVVSPLLVMLGLIFVLNLIIVIFEREE